MSKRILIVEDEQPIREMVVFALGKAGYELVQAEDVQEAYEAIAHQVPDLVLLDWMLPGASGIELAKRMKADEITADVPIVMLTARGEEEDKVSGLEAGADDYVTKPFSPRELIARIKAVLRRYQPEKSSDWVQVGGLALSVASHQVMAGDTPVDIGPTEFKLLAFLLNHPERVYSRAQLLDHVWGRDSFVEERTVDVHILRLRKALAPVERDHLVQTVRGVGYRLSSNT